MTWRQYAGNFDNPINPEYEQEARLVEQSRAGSERAFSALLARYQQPVFRLIFYLVGDDEEARDLTRIAIKNALLHMPSVPAGFSIRPWLLRVAVLVALDAVRERSETPQQLLESLQLPAPAAPPRIVDADPSDTDTMELGITRMETLAQRPETAIADAWDTLPVDVERELIRRLLSGLPEGDAELLALGVVGQIPTRDLAALAGTSQRSIRRRIARALILFQSRYYSVRHDALPPASTEKSLPLTEAATTPIELARRGFTDASDRVMRTLQGVRTSFGSTDAQERLQTLRATDVPAAEVVTGPPPATPLRSLPLAATSPRGLVDAEPTMPLPRAGNGPPEDVNAAFADWTASVPSMDVPDLATAHTPAVTVEDQATAPLPRSAHGPPPPSVIPMPPANSTYTSPATRRPAEDVTVPAPVLTEAITTPASASLSALTEPLPSVAVESATVVRPAPIVDAAASGAAPHAADVTLPVAASEAAPTLVRPDIATAAPPTVPRRLPRFGPPPEEVVTAATGIAAASELAATFAAPSDIADAATLVPAEALSPTDPIVASDDPTAEAPAEAHDIAPPAEPMIASSAVDQAETVEAAPDALAIASRDLAEAGTADVLSELPTDNQTDAPTATEYDALPDVSVALHADAAATVMAEGTPPAETPSLDVPEPPEASTISFPDTFADSAPDDVVDGAAVDAVASPLETADAPASALATSEAVAVLADAVTTNAPEAGATSLDATAAAPTVLDADEEAASDSVNSATEIPAHDDAVIAPLISGIWLDDPSEDEFAPVSAVAAPSDSTAEEAPDAPTLAEPAGIRAAEEATDAATLADVASVGVAEEAPDASVLAEPTGMRVDDVLASADAALPAAFADAVPDDTSGVADDEGETAEASTTVGAATAAISDEAEPASMAMPEMDATVAIAEATPDSTVDAAEADAGDTVPAPPLAAIERAGGADLPRRQGILNSTIVLPPLDRADYVSRHRPAWLDMGDLGSLPGIALDANAASDVPVASSPSVPSYGALTVAPSGPAPEQVGEIAPADAPAHATMDLADLADVAEPASDAASPQGGPTPPKPTRAPTRPLPRIDRDIIDPPRER